jgi:hypothetical protein
MFSILEPDQLPNHESDYLIDKKKVITRETHSKFMYQDELTLIKYMKTLYE